MRTGGRILLLALAWLASAAAAGLLSAWLLRREPEIRIVLRDRPAEPGAGRDATTPAANPRPGGPDPAAPQPGRHPREGGPAGGVEDTFGAAGWIEVNVRLADGTPAAEVLVYALPAGEPGADDSESIPTAETDAEGGATIPVAVAGLYDVGAIRNCTGGLARDVRVTDGATSRCQVALPDGQPVLFELTPWPPAPGNFVVMVSCSADSEEDRGAGVRRVYLPGRGEALQGNSGSNCNAEGKAWSVEFTAGSRVHFGVTAYEQRPTPGNPGAMQTVQAPFVIEPQTGTATAGETVRLRVRERSGVTLHVRTEPQLPPDRPMAFVLTLHHGGGREESRMMFAGVKPDQPPWWVVRLEGLPGSARVEWREDAEAGNYAPVGIAPGALDRVEVGPGEGEPRDVVFRIDAAQAARPCPTAPVEDVVHLVFLGVPAERRSDGSWCAVVLPGPEEEPDDLTSLNADFGGDGLQAEAIYRGRKAFFTCGPDLVSEMTVLPEAGPAQVRLSPGGLLLVAPEFILDGTLGRLTLRRPDGLPLALNSGAEDGWSLSDASFRPEVGAGTLLGPLPPGAVTFEVRLGGARLPDATAAVRAGRIEVLRIRR
jgi:hypothetical protein